MRTFEPPARSRDRSAGARRPIPTLLAPLLAAALLAGCATPGAAIRSESAPGESVATRAAFAWEESGISWQGEAPKGADAEIRGIVRDAVLSALTTRGYRENAAAPDFLVSYQITVRDAGPGDICQMRNDVFGRYAFHEVEVCQVRGAPGDSRPVRKGTLIVFAVDRRNGVLLWQGVAEGSARSLAEARTRLRAAIASLFRDFPARAG